MEFILIIIIAIVIVFLLMNKNEVNENVDGISAELCQMLHLIEAFANTPFWRDECGLVMVIPVNNSGDMYRPDSKRLQVSLLLYREDEQTIKLCSQNDDITSRFKLVQEGRDFSYIATTYCTFNSNYKKIMPLLYERVHSEFPNISFKFDGSRISTNSMSE